MRYGSLKKKKTEKYHALASHYCLSKKILRVVAAIKKQEKKNDKKESLLFPKDLATHLNNLKVKTKIQWGVRVVQFYASTLLALRDRELMSRHSLRFPFLWPHHLKHLKWLITSQIKSSLKEKKWSNDLQLPIRDFDSRFLLFVPP